MIITGVIVGVSVYYLTVQKPETNITYKFIETLPYKEDYKGQLHLDYEQDKNISGVLFEIVSNGSKEDTNLRLFNNSALAMG